MTSAKYCPECGVNYGIPGTQGLHDKRECEWMARLTEEQKQKLWDVHRIVFHKSSARTSDKVD